MYEFKVGEKTYLVKFGYGALYKSDIMDRVLSAMDLAEGETPADLIKRLIGLTAELLLIGLQKKHSDEFGFETQEEREKALMKVCDLIDDYEEEHRGEEPVKNGFTLYTELNGELEANGFLSEITNETMKLAAEQDATVIPLDHKRKRKKPGENK